MKKLALFASGNGTNAEQIIRYFHRPESGIKVDLILTNKPEAYVLQRAKKLNVDSFVFDRDSFYTSEEIVEHLQYRKIDLIVLAGFLWLIPKSMIEAFPQKIINIHPALLPKYGGKGMYGSHVHEAVVKNKETETGITIHLVDEIYDNGTILCQKRCEVLASDTPDQVAHRVHQLEYEYFPQVIEKYIHEV